MSKKCDLIKFRKTNKFIFFVFLASISYALIDLLSSQSKFFNDENLHPIIFSISYTFGISLSFILYIIYRIRNKSNKTKIKLVIDEQIPISFYSTFVKPATNKEKFLWIILTSILDFISCLLNSIFWVNLDNYLNTWAFTIIAMSLFSYWILKFKLFKHHYISMAIIVLIGILYNIFTDRFILENMKKNYIFYLVYSLNEILISFNYVLYKYLMDIKYIKSYEILFFDGLIELTLSIITLIITTNIGNIDNFWDYYQQLDLKEILIFFSIAIFYFIFTSLVLTVIDIFSPFHVFLLNNLSEVIIEFYNISNFGMDEYIFSLLSVIIVFIVTLVFVEIIELNFCNISSMTKENIKIRARLDTVTTFVDYKENKSDEVDKIEINNNNYLIELKNLEDKEFNDN